MQEFLITSPDSRQKAVDALMALGEGRWVCTLKRYQKRRSLNQNALLHKWLEIIADHTGHDMEEIKAMMKDRFLAKKPVTIGKVTRLIHPGTANLDVSQMSEFMSKVQAFAATDLQISLPSPDTYA